MDRKIAIIGGTGDQGMGLALRLAMAGENVIIGSRDAKRARDTVDRIKEMTDNPRLKLEGMNNEDAASLADIIILTVPLHAQMATLKSIKEHTKGKIFIDATVPLESSLGGSGVKYLDLWDGSAAERSAKFLKDTTVVSAFNNISAHSLLKFKEDVECDCLITSDDEKAKKLVIELAEKIPGIRGIDCGPLENARIIEKITPLLINLNMKNRIKNAGIRITNI
ncbi:MAG TPA: NADPH-dependent F420 reductase [Methanothermobacter sp.]|jgi:NADPH-dependent F420 reductase|uniref:NADPH-dependent F420 reductase n=1 Tax=Methanothermobacter tenebrarum TaxID=680118 RepID=A0ABM7YDG3_9EURY|nr:NADPH-dependent F420 reductase [Methanothermobacter tenebrarum]MDD3454780.1 NADPH-dependent F420 reductase [Methanobacteriales archaeon]MDX9693488.1 NADPH-dependent F420 reductase [Methanothermobacter sp.]BDH79512.1 NADPH-dependent F420 reductase [Methanothermobacter tenebrarum]HHW15776.1 NADPH-dependent F420 reductase [Methanothermobacter sp.]HOQ20000.1 NADPH-dependent F420 reductase [Methanothermobacter sp.]